MLDPRGREQVMQTIHHLNRDLGITVVSITHYMEEAAQADRVLVMSQGSVVMEGTLKEVFSQTEKSVLSASTCRRPQSCGMSWSRPASPCPKASSTPASAHRLCMSC